MRRKLVSAVVLATMSVTMLAGCGAKNENSSSDNTNSGISETVSNNGGEDTKSKEDEPVTLTVLAGQSTTDAGIEDMIDTALKEKYPHITLEWECVDWGNDFQPKMQQYMQSGLPDIMIGKAQDVATYGAQGILGEIDEAYLSAGLDAARENVTIDGKTYGLVYNALYQGVYYNKDMFEENGWSVPNTLEELQAIINDCNAKGITPFASHMVDTWSIGNVTMQFMMNDVFNNDPTWGDKFREGSVNFTTSEMAQSAYKYNQLIYENTFDNTFSTEQTDSDAKMVLGEAAMKVSGSWSIQNFLDINPDFNFGIFPFPNQSGDSKLIFEPNITFMTSATTEHQDTVNKVLEILTTDTELAIEIYDYTKTASMLKGVSPTFANPSQEDIDKYAAEGRVVDVTLGNNQLVWGGFQEENAKDIAAWLQGQESFEDCLAASDGRVDSSK